MQGGFGRVGRLVPFVAAAVALLVAPFLVAPGVAEAATRPTNHAQFVARVIELTNAERKKVGAPALVAHAALTQAAQDYAVVLADGSCFSHSCRSTLTQRLDRAGYTNRTTWGENIAWGQSTPEAVVAAWMNSSGHRANILNPKFKEIGVGLAARSGTSRLYWVQTFGARR